MRLIDVERVRRSLAAATAVDAAPRQTGRHAAVACVLRDSAGGAEVLLIKRATHTSDPWSGHMAFPGGRHEASDPDLLCTATRETLEEVGLDLAERARVIGRLEDTPAIAGGNLIGLTIAPFVFELQGDAALRANHEVEATVWVPLTPILAGRHDVIKRYRYAGKDLDLPAWDVDGRVVWGLTHRMLSALLERVRLEL